MDPAAKPRAQAKTWDAARRRAGLVAPALADITGPWRTLLAQWGIAEVAPGRLVPWLAVAFGFGIVGYFTADREAAWWAAWMAAVLAIAIAYEAQLRPVGFPFALGVAGIVAGFAAATVQTVRIAHPVPQFTGISRHRRQLAVLSSGRDTFAVKKWLVADADARTVKDPSLHSGVRCDAAGCIGTLADGHLASVALSVEAFEEDCRRAAVVVSAREAPGACAALLIDRKMWRGNGAIGLRRVGERYELSAARPPGYERPWARPPRIVETAR